MVVFNIPSDWTGPDGDPLPGTTFPALVRDLRLGGPSVEVGAALARSHKDDPWEDVWAGFLSGELDELSPNNYRGTLADSPTSKYFLVVRRGRVEVIYGWSNCRPLAASGGRSAGLMGERRVRRGVEVQPKLVTAGNTQAAQDTMFQLVTVRPRSYQEIETALEAEGATGLVGAAVDEDGAPWPGANGGPDAARRTSDTTRAS